MLKRRTPRSILLLAALAACGGDDDHHADIESCERIIEACHTVDTGVGEIGDCHAAAHDVGTAAACDPIVDRCVMVCEAAAGDGGAAHGDGGE